MVEQNFVNYAVEQPTHAFYTLQVEKQKWSQSWDSALTWNLPAPQEAMERDGCPRICNTDQGCQFTSLLWTDILKANDIRISMDGKGRSMDNVFIKRLWRSLKYECVYLDALQNFADAHRKIASWIGYYNRERPHSSLGDFTPVEVYRGMEPLSLSA